MVKPVWRLVSHTRMNGSQIRKRLWCLRSSRDGMCWCMAPACQEAGAPRQAYGREACLPPAGVTHLDWHVCRFPALSQVRGQLLSLHALRLASSGQTLPASRHFAAALHMCPWDTQCRTLMSAACSAHATSTPTSTAFTGCTPRHTAAGRAAPRLPLHISPPAPSPPPRSLHPTPTYGDATSGVGSHTLCQPMGHPHSSPVHPVAGHITRSAALTATLAAPALEASCARELVSLRHAMHANPTALLPATTAALLSLQLAGCDEGRPCAAYRTTMHGYVRLALALTHRELGLLPGSGGGVPPPVPQASPPPPASLLSMFPLMQLHAALSGPAQSGSPTPGEWCCSRRL